MTAPGHPDLRIELPAEPASVGEVRRRVREHAAGLDLSPEQQPAAG